MITSREIIIEDDTGYPHCSFWCDAMFCDSCPLRYLCLTTKDEKIVVTYMMEEIDKKIDALSRVRWRLRDGSAPSRTPSRPNPLNGKCGGKY